MTAAAEDALATRGAEIVRAHVGAVSDDIVLAGTEAVIHLAALPGVMIFAVSICFNLLSDGMRSAMDIRN